MDLAKEQADREQLAQVLCEEAGCWLLRHPPHVPDAHYQHQYSAEPRLRGLDRPEADHDPLARFGLHRPIGLPLALRNPVIVPHVCPLRCGHVV